MYICINLFYRTEEKPVKKWQPPQSQPSKQPEAGVSAKLKESTSCSNTSIQVVPSTPTEKEPTEQCTSTLVIKPTVQENSSGPFRSPVNSITVPLARHAEPGSSTGEDDVPVRKVSTSLIQIQGTAKLPAVEIQVKLDSSSGEAVNSLKPLLSYKIFFLN